MEQILEERTQERLAEWVDAFLRGEGNNAPLADGLQKQKRYWIYAEEMPLNRLERCCGPEAHMEYVEPEESWGKRTDSLAKHIQSGGTLAPFIATYNNGRFSVRDGNHRYGACEKAGVAKHDTLIWCDTEEEFQSAKRTLSG